VEGQSVIQENAPLAMQAPAPRLPLPIAKLRRHPAKIKDKG
jgi:hypothetical protein